MKRVDPHALHDMLCAHGLEYYYGVPDSLVSSLSFFLHDNYPAAHTIAANEGNAIGQAIGYHFATSNVPVVYMQNSGLSNALDPLASLVDADVFDVPMLLLISWRGQPGGQDEPQHIRQGAITTQLLELLEIPFELLDRDPLILRTQVDRAVQSMKTSGKPYALLVEKDYFVPYGTPKALPNTEMSREAAIEIIATSIAAKDIIVSGIGKVSRELSEYRDRLDQDHDRDVLVVGGMGHASSIALGVAENQKNRRVYCLDGDGATRMHMGALTTIGARKPVNLIHIIFQNGVHDSVGGQQLPGPELPLHIIAEACGYATSGIVDGKESLQHTLRAIADTAGPHLVMVRVKPGSRHDLGRPTISPEKNKRVVQSFLRKAL